MAVLPAVKFTLRTRCPLKNTCTWNPTFGALVRVRETSVLAAPVTLVNCCVASVNASSLLAAVLCAVAAAVAALFAVVYATAAAVLAVVADVWAAMAVVAAVDAIVFRSSRLMLFAMVILSTLPLATPLYTYVSALLS